MDCGCGPSAFNGRVGRALTRGVEQTQTEELRHRLRGDVGRGKNHRRPRGYLRRLQKNRRRAAICGVGKKPVALAKAGAQNAGGPLLRALVATRSNGVPACAGTTGVLLQRASPSSSRKRTAVRNNFVDLFTGIGAPVIRPVVPLPVFAFGSTTPRFRGAGTAWRTHGSGTPTGIARVGVCLCRGRPADR